MLKLYQKILRHFSSQDDITQVRNHNLKFSLEGWNLHLFPFHPPVIKRPNNIYEIKKSSSVLALTFVPKVPGLPDDQAWQSRKSMTFKFIDLAKLINIKTGFGGQEIIETSKQYQSVQQIKKFTLIDHAKPKQSYVELNMQSNLKYPSENQFKLQFELYAKMGYADYNLMKQLIEGSLCELSGWKFMLDIQRKKILESIIKNESYKNDLDLLTDDMGLKKR